jgi:hypothetical protein
VINRNPGSIATPVGAHAVLQGYLEAFEAGRARPLGAFGGDLSTGELCRLLGACSVA